MYLILALVAWYGIMASSLAQVTLFVQHKAIAFIAPTHRDDSCVIPWWLYLDFGQPWLFTSMSLLTHHSQLLSPDSHVIQDKGSYHCRALMVSLTGNYWPQLDGQLACWLEQTTLLHGIRLQKGQWCLNTHDKVPRIPSPHYNTFVQWSQWWGWFITHCVSHWIDFGFSFFCQKS